MRKKISFIFLFSLLLIIIFTNTLNAQQLTREEERIIKSLDAFQKVVERENQTEVISELLQQAQGIAIFPKLTKIGLGVGV